MKTKITSFLTFAVASLIAFSSTAFADGETGFYESDHVRGFISIGADYRGMRSAFQDYVNSVAFRNGVHMEEETVPAGDTGTVQDTLVYAILNEEWNRGEGSDR